MTKRQTLAFALVISTIFLAIATILGNPAPVLASTLYEFNDNYDSHGDIDGTLWEGQTFTIYLSDNSTYTTDNFTGAQGLQGNGEKGDKGDPGSGGAFEWEGIPMQTLLLAALMVVFFILGGMQKSPLILILGALSGVGLAVTAENHWVAAIGIIFGLIQAGLALQQGAKGRQL